MIFLEADIGIMGGITIPVRQRYFDPLGNGIIDEEGE
jgi:hypothetical protein